LSPLYLILELLTASRLVTRWLENEVRRDDEEAVGHAVLFALGQEQAVGIATVAHTPQEGQCAVGV